MRPSGYALLGSACILSLGCVSQPRRGYPLYSSGGDYLEPANVATLYGEVAEVDGEPVAKHGRSFELLPGCHVVGISQNWGGSEPTAYVVAWLPPWQYALPMKAQHSYVLSIDASNTGGSDANIVVRAVERNSEGEETRSFRPIESQADIDECHAEM